MARFPRRLQANAGIAVLVVFGLLSACSGVPRQDKGTVSGDQTIRDLTIDRMGRGERRGASDVRTTDVDLAPRTAWLATAGGEGFDSAGAIAFDGLGNWITSGQFELTATFGALAAKSSGKRDAFLATIDSNGSWTSLQTIGTPGMDGIGAVAASAQGSVLLSAYLEGTLFFGGQQVSVPVTGDVVFAELASTGAAIWVMRPGGGIGGGSGIVAGGDGNRYLSSLFTGTASFGQTAVCANGASWYVARTDSSVDAAWVLTPTGSGAESISDMVMDSIGNIFVVGHFHGTMQVLGTDLVSTGGSDAFILKLSNAGNLVWAASGGGTADDVALAVAADGKGGAAMVGNCTGHCEFSGRSVGGLGLKDALVARYDELGNCLWAFSGGGPGHDGASAVVIDKFQQVVIAGQHSSPATLGSITLPGGGGINSFVAALDASGAVRWALEGVSTAFNGAGRLAYDGAGGAVVTGSFYGTASFGGVVVKSHGSSDAYAWKITLPALR